MDKTLTYEDYYIWQDREIRFDILKSQLALRQGEKAYDTIANVEDTKGNNGDIGSLIFTNLRLIWYCQENIKMNLSIGYDCVLNFDIKSISSKAAGDTSALAIKCKFNNNRFEFVFNSISDNSPILFSSFKTIYKSYDSSRLYRDIKMKGFLTNDKNFIILAGEKFLTKSVGVSSVTNDQALIGTFILTNIRLIWYSNNVDNFNLSLPWIQIRGIRLKDLAKNGKVIAIDTGKGVILNTFHFKFSDRVEFILKEIENFYYTNVENPILGEDLSNDKNNSKQEDVNGKTQQIENKMKEFNDDLKNNLKEEVDIIETNYFNENANMLHYLTSNQEKKNSFNDVVYSYELGLAIEKIPDNISLDNLWRIIPS